jgi:cytochrome c oxidase assembly protein subunit 15
MTADPLETPATRGGRYRPGPHRVALFAAVFTLPLLFVGGSVTSYGVGMAVPDWPTTFGMNMFLYNFWNDSLGVKLEHTHRLYGAAVGLATVVLAVWFLRAEPRRSVKVLGLAALAAVIVQGVMGGLRVNRVSTLLAAVHGGFGQAFFALMVCLCVLTSRDWLAAGPPRPDARRLRRRSLTMLVLVYAQVLAGAWFRHFPSPAALWTHLLLAAAVWGHAAALTFRTTRSRVEAPSVWTAGLALGLVTTTQVVLGALALWLMLPLGGNPRTPTLWQAMLRTAHQTNGALLLATSVVLTLRAFRHLAPAASAGQSSTPNTEGPRVPTKLETVA